jgi:hypothetical protein
MLRSLEVMGAYVGVSSARPVSVVLFLRMHMEYVMVARN